jgi:hypothetical protein
MTFRVATSRQQRNPVRVQEWNGSLRAGDDLKLALTVYADDLGTLAAVPGSRSQLALYYDERRGSMWGNSWGSGGYCCDYGWDWFTYPRTPVQVAAGYVAGSAWPGQVNFYLPPDTTKTLTGRYRMLLELDMDDGTATQIEGILQVRGGITNTLGHIGRSVFTLDQSALDGPDVLAGLLNDAGQAVDADGFPWQVPNAGTVILPAVLPPLSLVATGLIATGANQATALALAAQTNVFSSGGAGTGGRLPASVLSGTIFVVNKDPALLDKLVYPPLGGTIDAAAVNVPVIVSAGQRIAFMTQNGVAWASA